MRDFLQLPLLSDHDLEVLIGESRSGDNLSDAESYLGTPVADDSSSSVKEPYVDKKLQRAKPRISKSPDETQNPKLETKFLTREVAKHDSFQEHVEYYSKLNHSDTFPTQTSHIPKRVSVINNREPIRESTETKSNTGKKKKKIMLDDFLWALLHDETYISCIQWTMKERLEFKFTRPEMVAKLWGDFKKKKRMNYEKLSRGLRYYYHSKKLERIQHKHYHFRFLTTKESDNIEINLTGDKSLDG